MSSLGSSWDLHNVQKRHFCSFCTVSSLKTVGGGGTLTPGMAGGAGQGRMGGPLHIPFGWVMGPLDHAAEGPSTRPGTTSQQHPADQQRAHHQHRGQWPDGGLLGSVSQSVLGKGSWSSLYASVLFRSVSPVCSTFPIRLRTRN